MIFSILDGIIDVFFILFFFYKVFFFSSEGMEIFCSQKSRNPQSLFKKKNAVRMEKNRMVNNKKKKRNNRIRRKKNKKNRNKDTDEKKNIMETNDGDVDNVKKPLVKSKTFERSVKTPSPKKTDNLVKEEMGPGTKDENQPGLDIKGLMKNLGRKDKKKVMKMAMKMTKNQYGGDMCGLTEEKMEGLLAKLF